MDLSLNRSRVSLVVLILLPIVMLFSLPVSAQVGLPNSVAVELPPSASDNGALARFLTDTEGLTIAKRYRYAAALGKLDRQQLTAEFNALPQGEKMALKSSIPGGDKLEKAYKSDPPMTMAGIGTVQYDSGVAHSAIPVIPGTAGVDVGNRFNNSWANPHSISKVTFQVNGNFFGSMNQLRVYGPPGTAGNATQLAGGSIMNTVIGMPAVYTLPTAVTGLSGSFLVGVLQIAAGPTPVATPDNPAVDINSGGLGFHGMSIMGGVVPGIGTGFNPSPTVAPGVPFNAIIRATGNNLPVELMSFTIDE